MCGGRRCACKVIRVVMLFWSMYVLVSKVKLFGMNVVLNAIDGCSIHPLIL
jgi:hypothetical protein